VPARTLYLLVPVRALTWCRRWRRPLS